MTRTQLSAGSDPAREGASPPDQIPDASRVLMRLVLAVFGSQVVVGALSAGGVALVPSHTWWRGLLAASIIAVAGAISAFLPLVPCILSGMNAAVYGYLTASALRMLVMLGGCLASVMLFRAPALPTLLLVTPMFFAQLIAEAVVMSGALWPRKST